VWGGRGCESKIKNYQCDTSHSGVSASSNEGTHHRKWVAKGPQLAEGGGREESLDKSMYTIYGYIYLRHNKEPTSEISKSKQKIYIFVLFLFCYILLQSNSIRNKSALVYWLCASKWCCSTDIIGLWIFLWWCFSLNHPSHRTVWRVVGLVDAGHSYM